MALSRDSLRYKIHTVIFESDTPAGKLFDLALLIIILGSVLLVMLESVPSVHGRYGPLLFKLEWAVTLLFTAEYFLRIYSLKRPSKYIFSFYGLVDLLAILPTYLDIIFAGGHYLMIVRILRVIRVFRILKLVKYIGEAGMLVEALNASRPKITVFLVTVLSMVVIVGSLMYLIEGPQYGFTSIPHGVYWAVVTLTTVGYGDIVPQTMLGKCFASGLMIMGYGLIAVPTGIVSVELHQAQAARKVSTQACISCGREGHAHDAAFCKYCGDKINP